MMDKDSKDYQDLKKAVELLESPSLVAKMTELIGSPIETLMKKLPDGAQGKIGEIVHVALTKAADAALWSLDAKAAGTASNLLHKAMAATSGAIGGAFGFTALAVELPITTTIMLRSVADIARSEGFDLEELDVKASCIEVFAMGGPSKQDDASESAYYATRALMTELTAALAKEMAEIAAKNATVAATKAAGKAASGITSTQAAGLLGRIIEAVAARFGVVITEKVAAQAVPVIGAISGATLNALFTDFYQDVARGHFTVKRLEKTYGAEEIRARYEELSKARGR